jgi:hypothetical protein
MKAQFGLLACLLLLLAITGTAQRGGAPHGGMPQGGGMPRAAAPRANQGRIPPPPTPRTNPSEKPRVEHDGQGRPNATPHVNNNHWYGHDQPNDPRYKLDHPFEHGHFQKFGPAYRYHITRIDPVRHRFWFPGGFFFDVAVWDWPICADWCWTCGDDFVIYEDPDHPGWYLLYNVYTGVYVHVSYMGM